MFLIYITYFIDFLRLNESFVVDWTSDQAKWLAWKPKIIFECLPHLGHPLRHNKVG